MNLFDLFEDSGVLVAKKQAAPDIKSTGNQFVKFCVKNLGIKTLPKIKLVQVIGQSEHPTFGLFDPNTNTISVAIRDRHIMDIMRTLAHELTHHKQREENRIEPDSGETGSEIENEANAQAGVLMRDFADQNPGLFNGDNLQEMLYPGNRRTGGAKIKITKHALDRIEERGIPISTAKEMLDRIAGMSSEFQKLPKDERFWVHDRSLDISFGFVWAESGALTWATSILGNPHERGRYQIFDIE